MNKETWVDNTTTEVVPGRDIRALAEKKVKWQHLDYDVALKKARWQATYNATDISVVIPTIDEATYLWIKASLVYCDFTVMLTEEWERVPMDSYTLPNNITKEGLNCRCGDRCADAQLVLHQEHIMAKVHDYKYEQFVRYYPQGTTQEELKELYQMVHQEQWDINHEVTASGYRDSSLVEIEIDALSRVIAIPEGIDYNAVKHYVSKHQGKYGYNLRLDTKLDHVHSTFWVQHWADEALKGDGNRMHKASDTQGKTSRGRRQETHPQDVLRVYESIKYCEETGGLEDSTLKRLDFNVSHATKVLWSYTLEYRNNKRFIHNLCYILGTTKDLGRYNRAVTELKAAWTKRRTLQSILKELKNCSRPKYVPVEVTPEVAPIPYVAPTPEPNPLENTVRYSNILVLGNRYYDKPNRLWNTLKTFSKRDTALYLADCENYKIRGVEYKVACNQSYAFAERYNLPAATFEIPWDEYSTKTDALRARTSNIESAIRAGTFDCVLIFTANWEKAYMPKELLSTIKEMKIPYYTIG